MKGLILMRRISLPLALLAATTLSACAVGPNYSRPSAPVSPTYKEAQGWTPAAPGELSDKGDWWTLFGDPVLNDLEAKVSVSNQSLLASEAAYRQARALVSEQRAALFPTVDLTGNGTKSGGGSKATSSSPTGSPSRGTSYRASLGASWEIDVWGRIRRTIEGAKASAQASAADLAAARLSLQGELAVNYVGLRETDVLLALDRANVEGYRRTLEISQNQYRAGTAPRSDVLQAQSQLDSAMADLAGQEQTRATYEHAIAVLVGLPPGSFSLPVLADWTPTTPETPPGVPSELLQRRPDIAAAERRVAAANANIGVERAAYFPSLTLSGSYGFAATELGSLFDAPNSLWSYGLAVAETVFDAGARGARVNEAKAAYDQAVANYRQTVLTALGDVENQLAATRVLARQEALRRDAADAATQAEAMVLNRYKAGQVSYVEVVTAQASAISARQALAQATAQRQTTAVALIQALGGGWKGQ